MNTQDSQAEAMRLPFLQAWGQVGPLLQSDTAPEDMEAMPACKRRCLEEKVIDVAMNDGCAQIKWQVLLQEASPSQGCGSRWGDLEAEWSEECEQVHENTKEWTDWMWNRVAKVDAPPQVRGDGKRHTQYTIEFQRGGATQVHLDTKTRRTVRRVKVTMGFATGNVRVDPYNLHNMPYMELMALIGYEGHTGATGSASSSAGPIGESASTSASSVQGHHHGQQE